MAGFCHECGLQPVQCTCAPSEKDLLVAGGGSALSHGQEKIGPFPKPNTPRRLLGSGVEFFAYVIAKGIIALLDALSFGLLGLCSLILFALIVLRDCNAGAFNIAKRVSHMRVIEWRTGQNASNTRGLLRNSYYLGLLLLAALLPLPLIDGLTWLFFLMFVGIDVLMILASPVGRRLGDLIAGTQVVEERA